MANYRYDTTATELAKFNKHLENLYEKQKPILATINNDVELKIIKYRESGSIRRFFTRLFNKKIEAQAIAYVLDEFHSEFNDIYLQLVNINCKIDFIELDKLESANFRESISMSCDYYKIVRANIDELNKLYDSKSNRCEALNDIYYSNKHILGKTEVGIFFSEWQKNCITFSSIIKNSIINMFNCLDFITYELARIDVKKEREEEEFNCAWKQYKALNGKPKYYFGEHEEKAKFREQYNKKKQDGHEQSFNLLKPATLESELKNIFKSREIELKKCDRDGFRAAYRKYSLFAHPDKNPSPEIADEFKKVNDLIDRLGYR